MEGASSATDPSVAVSQQSGLPTKENANDAVTAASDSGLKRKHGAADGPRPPPAPVANAEGLSRHQILAARKAAREQADQRRREEERERAMAARKIRQDKATAAREAREAKKPSRARALKRCMPY